MSDEPTSAASGAVAALGSIYAHLDEKDETESGRGRDLQAQVEIPDDQLGGTAWVEMPGSIDGVPRDTSMDEEGFLPLNLSEDFPNGGTLRLRGQGGRAPKGGRSGDLYLKVKIVAAPAPERASSPAALWIGAAAIVLAGAGAWWSWTYL